MSEEQEVVVVKRSRYPWNTLEVNDSFLIAPDNTAGIMNARQLAYAATKSAEKAGLPNKYKSFKQPDGSVEMKRIA